MWVLDGSWFVARLMIGLFGLIFLPGFIFANIALDEENVNIGSSLILGFMLQLLNVYVIWMLHIFCNPVNFALLMYTLTIIEVVLVSVLSYMRGLMLGISKMLNKRKHDPALVVILLYIVLALYWQQWAPAPHSDGAAYLDMARNVVNNGSFYSNMLLPNNTWSYVTYSSGMHTHMFGYFAIALFFMLGDISLFSAKIMLIFTGMLVIMLVYGLTKKLFNINVARLAALITAISPELLTHIGLVGGPEIPSALFILFTIYLLVYAPSSKRKITMALIAGLSLFIAWYAWEFNFLVMLTFLPLLFMYIASIHKEFKLIDILFLLLLPASFIIDYAVLLNLTWVTIGVSIPSLIMIAFIAIYLLRLKKSQNRNTLFTFTMLFLALYSLVYSRVIAGNSIPQVQQFVASAQPGMELVASNIAKDVGVLSRALSLEAVNKYWNMYWDGVYGYLGVVVVFLVFLSLARVDKLKETLLVLSFPLLQALWWGLFIRVDAFQPRFIVCSSLFCFVLVASVIDMIYSHALTTLSMTNRLRVNLKVKTGKIVHHINMKNLVAAFVVVLLLASVFNFTYPLYDKHKTIMEDWNYPRNLGWDSAIHWIKENTQPNDVIMTRHGSYFAWYADRLTVGLFPSLYASNLNDTELINLIREFKAKYLVIDYAFASYYTNLRELYVHPQAFYGSEVVFQHINDKGLKTIIYNITNIANGEQTLSELLITDAESSDHWTPCAYYGNGTIMVDTSEKVEGTSSILVTFTVIERPLPQAAVIFNPPEAWNFENFTDLELWVNIPPSEDVGITLFTDSTSYYYYVVDNIAHNEWTRITISINNPTGSYGSPTLSSIDWLSVYIRGLTPKETYTFWIDSIKLWKIEWVLKS